MRDDPTTILARHRVFWSREPADRPILSVQAYTPLQPLALDLPAAYLQPEQLRVEDVLRANQAMLDSGGILQGDLFLVGEPYQPVPWMEAIVGCPIRVSAQTGSFRAEPVADSPDAIRHVDLDERWLAKLLEYTQALVEHSRGVYPVVQALMRGPIDILAALVGDEVACMSLVTNAVQTRRLLSQLTDAFVEVVRRQMAMIPPYHGGYVNWYGLWCPGVPVRLQADNGALLSPQTYRHFPLPLDDRIARSFDYAPDFCSLTTEFSSVS